MKRFKQKFCQKLTVKDLVLSLSTFVELISFSQDRYATYMRESHRLSYITLRVFVRVSGMTTVNKLQRNAETFFDLKIKTCRHMNGKYCHTVETGC